MESLIESLSHPLPGFDGQLPITFFFMLPIFWVAVLVLNNLMLKPVMATVDRRKAATSGTSEGAAQVQSEAEHLIKDYTSKIQKTTDEAASSREAMLSKTRTDNDATLATARTAAESSITGARAEIRKETQTAREQLRSEVERIADDMARKLIGRAA